MACVFHKWDGCTCTKCGATRHVFKHPEFGACVCKRCGLINPYQSIHPIKTRGERANRCYCPRCKNYFHKWVSCKCKVCFETKHDWDGCICKNCGQKQPFTGPGHDWDGCVCQKCKTKKQADFPTTLGEVAAASDAAWSAMKSTPGVGVYIQFVVVREMLNICGIVVFAHDVEQRLMKAYPVMIGTTAFAESADYKNIRIQKIMTGRKRETIGTTTPTSADAADCMTSPCEISKAMIAME